MSWRFRFCTTDLRAYSAINQNFNKQFAESPKTRKQPKETAGEITCKIIEFALTRGNVNKKELKRCPSSLVADATQIVFGCKPCSRLVSFGWPHEKAHKTWLKNSRRNVSDRTCACGIAHQRTHEIPAHGYTDTKFNADDTAGRVQKLLSNQKNNTKIRKRYKDRPE